MTPPNPAKLNVAGQPFHLVLFKVTAWRPGGIPKLLQFLTEEEAVADTDEANTFIAYVPKRIKEGTKE